MLSKLASIFCCLLFTLHIQAQSDIEIRAVLSNTGVKLSLFSFNGFGFDQIETTDLVEDSLFLFKIPVQGRKFYYLGPQTNNLMPVILGDEKQVRVVGKFTDMRNAKIANSPINTEYKRVREEIYSFNRQLQQQNQAIRAAGRDEEKRNQAIEQLGELDQKRLELLTYLNKTNPYLASIAALNTYLSFQNHGQSYQNEVPYFANEFFKHADLSDPVYDNLPWTYEAFKNYTSTLNSIGLSTEDHQTFLDKQFAKFPEKSTAQRLAMGGALSAMQQKNHANFVPYAKRYLADFPDAPPSVRMALDKQVKSMASFVVGGEAPDFEAATPDGGSLSLSELRGKVVLIDFWASWCGPCRRENPNVKRVYDQYKDKGFEILGVSLDKTKDRWLKAIEDDGLPWPHISDLKGWQSGPAKLYSVRSIPHTVLLDAEGKIIARGLRGAALENKLAELFGTD